MKICSTVVAAVAGLVLAPAMAAAWTPASSSSDPQVAELSRALFMVVFPDPHALKPQVGDGAR